MDFVMNGIPWSIRRVHPDSLLLIDRTNTRTVATTDPYTHTVYLSEALRGSFLCRVLTHELGHCAMVSYGMLGDISSMTKPNRQIDMEEWICNFLADFGGDIFVIADRILQEERG